jgi:NitT/TauT family transport system permease protein
MESSGLFQMRIARRPAAHFSALRYGALSLTGFIVLWWVAAHLAGSPQLLPSPGNVVAVTWQQILNGTMPRSIGITLLRVLVAFSLAMAVGSAAGYLAGRSPRANALMNPWLIITLNLPVLVLIILVFIWVGLNEAAAVLAVVIAKIPTVMVTVREGAQALDPGRVEYSSQAAPARASRPRALPARCFRSTRRSPARRRRSPWLLR